jgi:hypothetical protein
VSYSTQVGLACVALLIAAVYANGRFGRLGALIVVIAGCALAGAYVAPIRSALLSIVTVIEIPLNLIRNLVS